MESEGGFGVERVGNLSLLEFEVRNKVSTPPGTLQPTVRTIIVTRDIREFLLFGCELKLLVFVFPSSLFCLYGHCFCRSPFLKKGSDVGRLAESPVPLLMRLDKFPELILSRTKSLNYR